MRPTTPFVVLFLVAGAGCGPQTATEKDVARVHRVITEQGFLVKECKNSRFVPQTVFAEAFKDGLKYSVQITLYGGDNGERRLYAEAARQTGYSESVKLGWGVNAARETSVRAGAYGEPDKLTAEEFLAFNGNFDRLYFALFPDAGR